MSASTISYAGIPSGYPHIHWEENLELIHYRLKHSPASFHATQEQVFGLSLQPKSSFHAVHWLLFQAFVFKEQAIPNLAWQPAHLQDFHSCLVTIVAVEHHPTPVLGTHNQKAWVHQLFIHLCSRIFKFFWAWHSLPLSCHLWWLHAQPSHQLSWLQYVHTCESWNIWFILFPPSVLVCFLVIRVSMSKLLLKALAYVPVQAPSHESPLKAHSHECKL